MNYLEKNEELKKLKLFREIKEIEKLESKYIVMNNRKYLDFSSSNYLGLRDDSRIIEKMKEALDIYGFGSGASRLVVGNSKPFTDLENYLSALENKEKTLVFNSGYDLNLGVISSIANEKTHIFCDKLNHASIYDGIRLSGAKLVRYKHNDIMDLKKQLEKYKDIEDKLLITDTVFSMDGDRAKLTEIVGLKKEFGFRIMIDEAHAGGILGKTGMGLVEELGLGKEIDIIMGTFSKAYGGQGAYLVGDKEFIDYIINTCRSLIYTTALPPSVIEGNMKALELSVKESFRRAKLMKNSEYLRNQLKELGYNIGNTSTHIIPILLKDNEEVLKYHESLLGEGIFISAIRKPTVVQARLRISLGYNIELEDINYFLEKLKEIKRSQK